MKCSSCGATRPTHGTYDVSYACRRGTTVTPSVTGGFYPACDEITLEREQGDWYGGLVSAL